MPTGAHNFKRQLVHTRRARGMRSKAGGTAARHRNGTGRVHTCLPLPIDRRGDAFGTKSRVCNSTGQLLRRIDYQSTIMLTGAHNFKRQLVHTRRARGHAQQGWRHGGVGTETCHGEEIHTCLPLPIDRRGDARFGTKSRVCNSTDGAPSCIDYQSTTMPTGAHNFKRQLVHTRRAPRGCSQPGEEAGGRRGSVSALHPHPLCAPLPARPPDPSGAPPPTPSGPEPL